MAGLVGDALQFLDKLGRLMCSYTMALVHCIRSVWGDVVGWVRYVMDALLWLPFGCDISELTESHGKKTRRGKVTFEILCRQENGANMMIFNEMTNLRSNFSSIPSHNQHLSNGPKYIIPFKNPPSAMVFFIFSEILGVWSHV
jgi:hypothetical protein